MATKKTAKKTAANDRIVLVRSGQSGVWIGTLVSREGDAITLRDARKIWRWRGANTTSELALHGCDSEGYTRVAEPTNVTVFGCCELHESNAQALARIAQCGWAR